MVNQYEEIIKLKSSVDRQKAINSACLPKSQKEYEGPRLINGALGFFRMFGMLY